MDPLEDPSDGFAHGGWGTLDDPAVGDFVTDLNGHATAFLLGLRTFDIFRGYWPEQTDPDNPIATAINSLPKYVVSNTLREADARGGASIPTRLASHAATWSPTVRALKEEPGDELQIWGVMLGSGRRMFGEGTMPANMKPVDITATDRGSSWAPTREDKPVDDGGGREDRAPHLAAACTGRKGCAGHSGR